MIFCGCLWYNCNIGGYRCLYWLSASLQKKEHEVWYENIKTNPASCASGSSIDQLTLKKSWLWASPTASSQHCLKIEQHGQALEQRGLLLVILLPI